MSQNKKRVAVVTGSAGFIGYHISKTLLESGWQVIGIDCITDYYDVSLKLKREANLATFKNYRAVNERIERAGFLHGLFLKEKPEIVIHLAAQVGVRSSINEPRSYLESNIIGAFELLEAAKLFPPKHILMASTSSAYGANSKMPYSELDRADHQMSFYAASKKSMENMAHSYSHLYKLPITIFRFFTVYGPWGRPDMAIFKFTKSIFRNEPIDAYNYGDVKRDFTFIGDLTQSVVNLIECKPFSRGVSNQRTSVNDNLSPVAPYRVVNIGNSAPVKVMDLISALEKEIGRKALINLAPMQAGDVYATWANVKLLKDLTGYQPSTDLIVGVSEFVNWYKDFYELT
ncbi:GDP-mannose 4,6-dehydratase [Planktomarina temperata]|nr:GDP-mannose 4,6-dehydratase [Planktomarina temperata]